MVKAAGFAKQTDPLTRTAGNRILIFAHETYSSEVRL
jgi:hypothetical protein